MCKLLNISRSVFYYNHKVKKVNSQLENEIIKIFKKNRNNYGTRKIKDKLTKKGYKVSRRKIGKIMKKYGLVSNYTVKQYKVKKEGCNEEKCENIVNREFKRKEIKEVVVSDLTYVNVKGRWNYICVIIDLYNREIIGYSVGKKKSAKLVYKAFAKIKEGLNKIKILHTDRGNEFKNKMIDELLKEFKIARSLSKKGNPYDNAVAEATFKVIKTEFINTKKFESTEELEEELTDYIEWYNNERIHGSLNYLTPVAYRELSEKNLC